MRSHLHYLLLDGFDPDTGELMLRVGVFQGDSGEPLVLRLKLHLGRNDDALQPLRRELQTHVQMPVPPLWDKGLKTIVRAIEDELATEFGRQPQRYVWVRTQMLHPTDMRRGTPNHSTARQAEILWDWAQRFDQDGDVLRAMELFERMLLLSPRHLPALARLTALLRQQGMVEEMLTVADRWIHAKLGKPEALDPEALLHRGEALLHLEHYREAQEAFAQVLMLHPAHPLAHIGAAQAKSYGGGDPCPHLDAALELNRLATLSVLRETFDYRVLMTIPGETSYSLGELSGVLGVSPGEVKAFIRERGLPTTGPEGTIREPELSRWVTLQNRYQLMPVGLHSMAPTPRHIPELPNP
jgi:hypothetical protein